MLAIPSMVLSFTYEVNKSNSAHYAAMYPGPKVGPDGELLAPSLGARESDPGYHKDALWVCSLCHKPVLDDRGIQKYARAFAAPCSTCPCVRVDGRARSATSCRAASWQAPGRRTPLASAQGTKPIDQVFVAASRW